VGWLWLQSVKNVLYVKSCVRDSLYKCQHKNVECVCVCVRKNIKKENRFICAQRGVPLHPEGCYTRYHTLKHYRQYVLNFKS
jgi:hypothetical protein